MKNNKIVVAIILFLIVAAGVIFWVVNKSNVEKVNNKPEVKLQKITIAEFGEVFLYAPLYIAQDKGFFKEEGLDVTIVPTGGDEKTFAALLSGDAQFGVADPTFVAISGEKGQPGKVISSILSGVPFWGVAKDKNIPEITKPAELGKYSVATFPSPSTAYALQEKMFKDGGLKPNIKETAFGSLLASLEAGKVDIALELEPNVSAAVKSGDKIVYALASYYPEFAITSVTALPDYLKNNPETAVKVVSAIQKSLDYIRSNPDDVAQILVKRFPEVNIDVAKGAVKNMIEADVFPKTTNISEASWNTAIELRKEAGDLKGDAPYSNYVTSEFSTK